MSEDKALEKSVYDILVEKVGKVDKTETYSNSTEFLIMFPNDRSIIVKYLEKTKKVAVEVYYGIGEVTHEHFKSKRASRKVRRGIILKLIEELENK